MDPDPKLELTEAHRTALRGLAAMVEALPSARNDRSDLAFQGFSVAAQTVSAELPPCPFAPPNTPVAAEYEPGTNRLILQCKHRNPSHCWDGYGATPREC